MFDFEGICGFCAAGCEAKKQPLEEETKRQKGEGGARKGKKGYKNKVIMKLCQGGELYSLFCRIVLTLEREGEVTYVMRWRDEHPHILLLSCILLESSVN